MKKIFLIPMFIVLAFGVVFAASFLVAKLNLTVGVAEPFSVEYAVIGDAGNWDGVTTCNSGELTWFTSTSTTIPTGDMLAGEGRGVCVKITNKAEAVVPYTINSYVTNDVPEGLCATAFGLPKTLTGSANANNGVTDGVTITGVGVIVNGGATPVSGCNVVIDVARG